MLMVVSLGELVPGAIALLPIGRFPEEKGSMPMHPRPRYIFK
jgi:hypothetical protein